jgi:hypothetical protein
MAPTVWRGTATDLLVNSAELHQGTTLQCGGRWTIFTLTAGHQEVIQVQWTGIVSGATGVNTVCRGEWGVHNTELAALKQQAGC